MLSISASVMFGNAFIGVLLYSLNNAVKYASPLFSTCPLFLIQACNNFLSVTRPSTPASAGPVTLFITAWQEAQLFMNKVLPAPASCALTCELINNKKRKEKR